jgi:fatty-acyl-CoA synthase
VLPLQLLNEIAAREPQRIALDFAGRRWTYAEFVAGCEVAARNLVAAGIERGDRVAFLGYNHPRFLFLLFAACRLGAIALPLNFRLAAAEHQAILSHAGVKLLLVEAEFAAAGAALGAVVVGLRPAPAGLLEQSAEPIAASAPSDAPCLLVYTSGTTGQPKGVLHGQAGLVANAHAAWDCHGMRADDVILTALPLFHAGGLCIQTVPALLLGARVVLHPRFDPAAWISALAEFQPSLALLVPATMQALLQHAHWPQAQVGCLRALYTGSTIVPVELLRRFNERGISTVQVYGATETGPVSIYQYAADAHRTLGSVGRAGPAVEVRLLDAGEREVAAGEVGELWLRAPNNLLGYWNDPHHPALSGGWFRSGDLARCDAEGNYTIVGRSKDMLISGGENIYPAEIELLLAAHPSVAEAAVFGVADPTWGDVPVAAVVAAPGKAPEPAELSAFCAQHLARYKLPRRFYLLPELPKNAMGKVQKERLRNQFSAALCSPD